MKSVLGRLVSFTGRRWVYSGMWVLLTSPFFGASAQASEASLRVAFVYNFLKFIEWPQAERESISLCVLGAEEPSRQALAQMEKKFRQQRRIRVAYFANNRELQSQLSSCHMLYRPESSARFILPPLLPAGILLVADEPDPKEQQVSIALVRTLDNRIEFIINEAAIGQAGVKVSSQLLKLAKKRSKEQR